MGKLDQRAAIEVDHLPLALAVQLGETAGQAEAGVVDQQLDMFAVGGEVGHQPVGRAGQAQIRSDRAGIAKLGRQRVEPILAAGDEHQPLALGRQLPGEIDAQPGRGAGDQRDAVGHLGDRRLDDLARLARRLADRKRVDMFHAALDLAPDGILAVEEARVVEADEELAVGAVRDSGRAPSSRCRGRAARC